MKNLPFPFGLPWPTMLYETLYVLTWVLHLTLAYVVLAGTAYVLWQTAVRPSAGDSPPGRAEKWLRDWLPACFSAAVTIGIAPLLFVQILYQEEFYTAHVLLWTRWMTLGPLLIGAFYLLYLLKTKWILKQKKWIQVTIPSLTLCSFAFAAWCWSENHMASLARPQWPQMYLGVLPEGLWLATVCRWLAWMALGMPVAAGFVVWAADLRTPPEPSPTATDSAIAAAADAAILTPASGEPYEVQSWSLFSLLGASAAGAFSLAYLVLAPGDQKPGAFGMLGGPWLLSAAACLGVLWWSWFQQRREMRWNPHWLRLAALSSAGCLLSAAMVREALRLTALASTIDRLLAQHALAAQKSGIFLFLFFAVVNTALCIWCVILVRRALAAGPPAADVEKA